VGRIGSEVRVSQFSKKNSLQVLSYGSNREGGNDQGGGCLGVDLLPFELNVLRLSPIVCIDEYENTVSTSLQPLSFNEVTKMWKPRQPLGPPNIYVEDAGVARTNKSGGRGTRRPATATKAGN